MCGVFCFFWGGLEICFCNFYEINSSQDFFCIAKILVLMVSKESAWLFCCFLFLPRILFGQHLVGVWIGGISNGHFPESGKYFSGAEICRKIPEIPKKERF